MSRRFAARLATGIVFIAAVGVAAPSAAPAAPSRPPGAVITAAPAALPAAPETVSAPDPRRVRLHFAEIATGLRKPTAIAAPDDDTGRIFVVEKRGIIRYYRAGRLRGVYLDIRDWVNDEGFEQGLLGLAFHRDFKTNPYFYVSYTKTNGALRIARYSVPTYTRARVDPATAVVILEIPHPEATQHNGGQLAFNRDRFLYISTGDGGSGGDPNHDAQNRGRLLGKILRIDVDHQCGGKPYCVPPGNPYFGSTTRRPEIWAYGLRNPWKFSFDRANGNLYVGDVGQHHREEISLVPYRHGGWNLGWNCYEGTRRYPGGLCLSGVRYHFPIREYGRSLGRTVIGGYVVRSKTYPALYGIYVYGDFISGRVWGSYGGLNAQIGSFPGSLTSFGESAAGNLFATDYDGRLLRVTASRR